MITPKVVDVSSQNDTIITRPKSIQAITTVVPQIRIPLQTVAPQKSIPMQTVAPQKPILAIQCIATETKRQCFGSVKFTGP